MVNNSGAAPVASFDNSDAVAILQALHNLRFTDHAMSATQGLAWGTLQQQFAAGKLGMYIAAPDDIYQVIVPTDKGNLSDIGMGALPSLTGTPAGSLSGGDAYIFAKHDTPAQIEAGIKFINFEDLTPGQRPVQLRQAEDGRVPCRVPRAAVVRRDDWRHRSTQMRTQYATINSLVLLAVREGERGRRRPADRRAGRLQDA